MNALKRIAKYLHASVILRNTTGVTLELRTDLTTTTDALEIIGGKASSNTGARFKLFKPVSNTDPVARIQVGATVLGEWTNTGYTIDGGAISGGGLTVIGASSPKTSVQAIGGATVEAQADGAAGYLGTVTNHPTVIRSNSVEQLRALPGGGVEVNKQVTVAAGAVSGAGVVVTGSSSPKMSVQVAAGATVEMQGDGAAGYLGTVTNHPAIIRANSVEQVRALTTGGLEVVKQVTITGGAAVGAGLTITGSNSPKIALQIESGPTAELQGDTNAAYFGTSTNHPVLLRVNNTDYHKFRVDGGIEVPFTNTATVGTVQINKMSGTANIAAAGTSVVVTNSLVSATSRIFAVASTADVTARVTSVVPATGSFTINTAAVTAQTSFAWFVWS